MGTRSYIAIKMPKGYRAIYCHWDGYPEGVGATLNEHYTNKKKVLQLIRLGSISSLGKEIGKKHPFSQFDEKISGEEYEKKYSNMTVAYGRDRGEKGQGPKSYATIEALREGANKSGGAEYLYIFENNKWRYETVKWQ